MIKGEIITFLLTKTRMYIIWNTMYNFIRLWKKTHILIDNIYL